MTDRGPDPESEALPLAQAAQHLLDECRMVLPGIQAIFGFQLIAVFNDRFSEDLAAGHQQLHLLALGLVGLAAALIMTPAAYHRHRESRRVTEVFLRLSSRLLLAAMLPLAAGLSLDFYLIATLVLPQDDGAPWVAAAMFLAMLFLWFVFPRLPRLHRAICRLGRPSRAVPAPLSSRGDD